MKNFLWILFHPSYWVMNNIHSRAWDNKLKELMKIHNFKRISNYRASIGGITVWIQNHPYASFAPEKMEIRASRITIRDAHEKYVLDILLDDLEEQK